jgi:hypothetical protein
LVGKGLDQGYLFVREWPDLQVVNRYDAEQGIAFKDGHGEHRVE